VCAHPHARAALAYLDEQDGRVELGEVVDGVRRCRAFEHVVGLLQGRPPWETGLRAQDPGTRKSLPVPTHQYMRLGSWWQEPEAS